ncbi:hypothetical protein [Modestobacter excelsi]|uniref:hypothetical protein n=1 Tax=Modestobacter excelsi TaxID=2213161 RepID=UPI001C20E852|nr:hypothetical protein [Modestobacter excelsi]
MLAAVHRYARALARLGTGRGDLVALHPPKHPEALAVPWPGRTVSPTACRAAVADAYGAEVAGTLVVLPLDRVPLTEQGKPSRPEIRRQARAAHLATSSEGTTP